VTLLGIVTFVKFVQSSNVPSLIVVTPLVTGNLLAELLHLQQAGRRLALVSLDENWTREELPGLVVYQAHAPA
jgi:hypothetical protein